MIRTFGLAVLLLVQLSFSPLFADESDFADLSADERLAKLKEEAASYELFITDGAEQKLTLADPVLRFNDNISGVVDAIQVVWFLEEQPHATASFWRRKDGLVAHEFQSLSERRIVAQLDNKTVWRPYAPGVVPRPLEGVPTPAKTRAGRMTQMRAAARQFSAKVVKRAGDRPLRLLSQPIARHGNKNAKVLDAAWFAFAKGTNPEVLLLIDARRNEDGDYAWHYSPVRMTSGECELRRNDHVAWTAARNAGRSLEGTYFNIYTRE